MTKTHEYEVSVRWTGNRGTGTSGYRDYGRDHELSAPAKPTISVSSDPAFLGDRRRWNPEELLVASLSQCHMLWYLHLAASAGVVVVSYSDTPLGTMDEDGTGAGRFSRVLLRPVVEVARQEMTAGAQALHREAHSMCFIARSVNFPVDHQPTARAVPPG